MSTQFKTYNWRDKVTIDGKEYSGVTEVNQIVNKNFTIYFQSDYYGTDEGFIIRWSCTEWAEWSRIIGDGTCNEEKRPIENGQSTIGHLKYRKNNSTCGKQIEKKK